MKKLSPEEEAVLEKRRQVFRNLVAHFAEEDNYTAEGKLSSLAGILENAFEAKKKDILVKDLVIISEDESLKKVLEVIGEDSVDWGIQYAKTLTYAISQERFNKVKHLCVKDLEIKVL